MRAVILQQVPSASDAEHLLWRDVKLTLRCCLEDSDLFRTLTRVYMSVLQHVPEANVSSLERSRRLTTGSFFEDSAA